MENNTKRLVLLLSLILIVVPMVVFPNRLGLSLASGSTIYMFTEMVFYGFVLFLFRREVNLVALIVGSALTLVYRMALGAVFGMTVMLMYGIDSTVAFSLGVTKYLPAVLMHMAAAPFVMRPVYLQLVARLIPSESSRQVPIRPTPAMAPREFPEPAALPEWKTDEEKPRPAAFEVPGEPPTPSKVYVDDENLFERAVAYLGETGAVRMALLVSEEGLPLARMRRGDTDSDLWAPLAVLLESGYRDIFNRFNQRADLDKLDISTRNMRVILRRIEHVVLMILADPEIDETIHIRIAQATDMVRKYMSERYSPAMFARVEENYVSNS